MAAIRQKGDWNHIWKSIDALSVKKKKRGAFIWGEGAKFKGKKASSGEKIW